MGAIGESRVRPRKANLNLKNASIIGSAAAPRWFPL
jgi:hypothetical protein